MPQSVTLDLGPSGAGWLTYFNVFSPDSTQVWNGSAFVANTTANQNTGGINFTEDVGDPGRFEGVFPIGIVLPGVYPIKARRRLGGANDVTIDTLLTYAVNANAVTIQNQAIRYHPFEQAGEELQSLRIYQGSGVPFFLVPQVPATLVAAQWEFRIGTRKVPVMLTLNSSNAKLSIDAAGTIAVNPLVADTPPLPLDQVVLGNLWRIGGGDDVIGVYARAKILVLPTQRTP